MGKLIQASEERGEGEKKNVKFKIFSRKLSNLFLLSYIAMFLDH